MKELSHKLDQLAGKPPMMLNEKPLYLYQSLMQIDELEKHSLISTCPSIDHTKDNLFLKKSKCKAVKSVKNTQFTSIVQNAEQLIYHQKTSSKQNILLFERNISQQRKGIKEFLKDSSIDFNHYQAKYKKIKLLISDKQSKLKLQISKEDLISLRKGVLNFQIIRSYIDILSITKIIDSSYHLFPIQFMQKLLGDSFSDQSMSSGRLQKQIRKIYSAYKSLSEFNIFSKKYLIVPILIQQSLKCLIIQLGSRVPNQRQKINIILCNICHKVGERIIDVLKVFLCKQHQQYSRQNQNSPALKINTIYLLLPRELNPSESGLYFLLYIEFLFRNRKKEEFHHKLHLFPKSIALISRQKIWNLFVSLLQESNPQSRYQICIQYMKKRVSYENKTLKNQQYDIIEEKEVKKYIVLQGKKMEKGKNHILSTLDYYLDSRFDYFTDLQD